MRHRSSLLLISVMWVLSACNLSGSPRAQETITVPTRTSGAKPTVVINSPQTNAEVVVDTEILVGAVATDEIGVTRVQLIANNQIVKTVTSESASGDLSFPVVLDYTPHTQGALTLQVIAFRGAVASDPAQIQVNVRASQAQVTATIIGVTSVPTIDSTDQTCRVLINVGLNFRTGPNTNYPVITTLAPGTVLPIVGRLGDNSWWQLRSGLTFGWVSAQFVSTFGNCFSIPVVVPPPSPVVATNTPIFIPTWTPTRTATPTLTLTPTISPTPGKPDLVITNFTGPTALVIPGGGAEISDLYAMTITNTGSASSGQFDNVITINPGAAEISAGVVGTLDSGQSIQLNINLTFTAAGNYTLQLKTDSGGNVPEISEVNNTAILNVTVTGP